MAGVGAATGGHGLTRCRATGRRGEAFLRVSAGAAGVAPVWTWVNAKRVLRLMREDNLLCLRTRRFVPATTDSRHGWRVWPNLARGLITRNLNELWVADSQQAPCPADENRSREDSRIAQHSLPEVREDNYASRDTASGFRSRRLSGMRRAIRAESPQVER